jgi:hypothetical protein
VNESPHNLPVAQVIAVAAALVLLSLLTGFSQIKTEGLTWQEAHYLPRLEAVAAGTAPSPWQYRVLSDRVVLAMCNAASSLGLPRPNGTALVVLRLLQNLALFLLAWIYYRRLGLAPYTCLLGLSAVAWGMTQANYGSDLAFNMYTDLLLYVAAAMVLLGDRPFWLIPLTLIAALNRETSGLIPVMALARAVSFMPHLAVRRSIATPALIALATFCAITAGLRLAYGARPWVGLEAGASPATGFLVHNLTNHAAWVHGAGVLGILPLLALLAYRAWHPLLRPLFWSVAPLWCLAHLVLAPLSESRVWLLPQVLIFVPALLCGIEHSRRNERPEPRGLLV